jgi:hypothetical protein
MAAPRAWLRFVSIAPASGPVRLAQLIAPHVQY